MQDNKIFLERDDLDSLNIITNNLRFATYRLNQELSKKPVVLKTVIKILEQISEFEWQLKGIVDKIQKDK